MTDDALLLACASALETLPPKSRAAHLAEQCRKRAAEIRKARACVHREPNEGR